ncbi:hypothetical protein A6R68_06142, partial [Neotoma lepida]
VLEKGEWTQGIFDLYNFLSTTAPDYDQSQSHKITQRNAILCHIASKDSQLSRESASFRSIQQLTQPIRLLLEYTDSSYEEKKYTMGDAPDYDQSQWLSEKFKLGLDFPNLPYLIDGSHKITQSNAIMRYIARKHNLCEWGCRVGDGGHPPCLGWGGMLRVSVLCAAGGETEEERIRADIVENQVMDNRMQLIMLCYSPDFEKQKPEFLKTIPEKMKLYSEFLGKRPWFAGDKITYVDFLAYDILDQHRIFQPHSLDAFLNLNDFMVRFEGLKKISDYMKSSRFIYKPFYVKLAFWNPK